MFPVLTHVLQSGHNTLLSSLGITTGNPGIHEANPDPTRGFIYILAQKNLLGLTNIRLNTINYYLNLVPMNIQLILVILFIQLR